MKQLALIMLLTTICFEGVAMDACQEGAVRTQAIQEIEYLRRLYAKATDLIGTAEPDNIEKGRAIYRAIFTEDAKMDAGPDREPQVGADAWLDLVLGVLGELGPTQHLIGTQLVEFSSLEMDDNCNIVAGSATMESYVQAWHEQPDDKVWLFLGTYFDDLVYVPGSGWRISEMKLQQVAGETRYMDAAVAGSK